MTKSREDDRLLAVAEEYFRTGRPGLAKLMLQDLLTSRPPTAKACELMGYIQAQEGDLERAHQLFEQASRLPRHSPEVLYYLGVARLKRQQPQAAIEAFRKSIALGGEFFEALHDLGTAHSALGDKRAALQAYERAFRLNPSSFDLAFNMGKVYDALKDYRNAIVCYDRAQGMRPDVADVWAHKGAVLYDTKHYPEAIAQWERALALQPDIDFLPGFLVHARLRLCDWSRWELDRPEILRRIQAGERACGPFEALALSDSDEINLVAAQRWVEATFPARVEPPPCEAAIDRKLRIGYFSADFGRHAVSYLTAQLYEQHDRSAFEIYAFALEDAAQGDEMRARLTRAFDRFLEVKGRSDEQIAQLSRELGIDIAVDLGGHTKGSRTGIFMRRAAPVQVNFLGYPGTMGAEFIDYIIADATVVPVDCGQTYAEKVVRLPDCFQPSDSTRTLPAERAPRARYGLPDSGFVFCCFNSSYKITPEVFAVWMRILQAVEGSCLWLLADVAPVEANLRAEAGRRGIDPDRLVFGAHLPLHEYLGRYRCADLFLDTLPFNAGTTANDALWAGLPVLTRRGGSFVGRMAASLLAALDLQELVVESEQEYEAAAISLARDPRELARVRDRLMKNREAGPLFDIRGYTRHLEAAYREMHRRCRAGLAPDHFDVAREIPPATNGS